MEKKDQVSELAVSGGIRQPQTIKEFQAVMRLPSLIATIVNLCSVLILGTLFLTLNLIHANIYVVWLLTFITLLSGLAREYFERNIFMSNSDSENWRNSFAVIGWLAWFIAATVFLLTSIVSITTSPTFTISFHL